VKRYDIRSLCGGKKVVAYGANLAFAATQATADVAFSYIVDDTAALQGQTLGGLRIYPPSKLLREEKRDIFVVPCAYRPGSILSIFANLNRMGFEYGTHYVDCSVLHFDSMSRKLRDWLGIEASYELFFKSRMLSLYGTNRNLSSFAGTWLYLELLDSLYPAVRGDVAECGIYHGGNAFVSLVLSRTMGHRTCRLFDSFEGFPGLSPIDPFSRRNDFDDIEFAAIRDQFLNFSNVRVHRGFFNETLPGLPPSECCFAYLDCDLFEPTLYCCQYFWERLAPGGFMLFHDYWLPDTPLPRGAAEGFPGVKKAVDQFLAHDLRRLRIFPETTHALIAKP
jgi:O-methyltransferase